jgi:TRAP-type C4-dicarboxylate transport system permease small subunit
MSLSAASAVPKPSPRGPRLFGIPYGEFGLFASLLLSLALGFITFFGVTFLSIFGILIYNAATHSAIDLSHGYKYVAFPAGLAVLAISLLILGTVWMRRRLTGK